MLTACGDPAREPAAGAAPAEPGGAAAAAAAPDSDDDGLEEARVGLTAGQTAACYGLTRAAAAQFGARAKKRARREGPEEEEPG